MSLADTLKERLAQVRRRRPVVDHVARTVEHYGQVNGSLQAGAVTYFAFLSFFPVLALSFAVVGWVSRVYPGAQQDLVQAIDQVLPGMVGNGEGQVPLRDIEAAAPGIASVGLVTVLYAGLGWLSAMRTALRAVFEKPVTEHPSLVVGKLLDLAAMVLLGVILMLSVAVSGVVTSLSTTILEALGLGLGLQPVVWSLALAVGLGANTVLFYAFFRLLGDPDAPGRSLWAGALLGAVGFELLKQLSRWLLASTTSQPAFQAFGIALVLVVWINYFSRVIVYAASWAHTTVEARALHASAQVAAQAVQGPRIDLPSLAAHTSSAPAPGSRPRTGRATAFAAGAASMLGLVRALRGSGRR